MTGDDFARRLLDAMTDAAMDGETHTVDLGDGVSMVVRWPTYEECADRVESIRLDALLTGTWPTLPSWLAWGYGVDACPSLAAWRLLAGAPRCVGCQIAHGLHLTGCGAAA